LSTLPSIPRAGECLRLGLAVLAVGVLMVIVDPHDPERGAAVDPT